jgi:hypothetical protein
MTPTTDHRPEEPRRRAPRVALITTAAVTALMAVLLLVAGGAALWGNAQKNEQGYLTTDSERFASETRAIATQSLDVDSDLPGWLVGEESYGDIRLQVRGNDEQPVFVGIAPTRDVERYLSGAAHATLTDVDYDPFDAEYRNAAGERPLAPPVEQYFWETSTHGPGDQVLTWDVRDGDWSVVVMNADGSSGVDVDVSAGANVPVLATIGWVLMATGGLLLTIAGIVLVLAIRAPRRPFAGAMTPAHAVI